MKWKLRKDKPDEYRKTITRKRKLFCWLPKVGSDNQWHWLETITRWESVNRNGVFVIIEKTGCNYYPPIRKHGISKVKLVEGPEEFDHS